MTDQRRLQVSEAQKLRDEAAAHDRAAQESFERSDTDGFLSQWASGLTAQLKRREADLLDAGGVATFPGLYDRETGERVRAKIVYVDDQYAGGKKPMWLVLDAADKAVMWLPAYKGNSKLSKLWKNGFEERDETAPAKAFMDGRGRGLSGSAWVATKRTDGGFPESARFLAEIRGGS
jgi:hypothetical protein